jgi:hypothetical protein
MRPLDDKLLERVRFAYERGRLVRALRTSLVVAPMVFASLGGCGKPSTSIVIGFALATLTTFFVWRGGSAGRAVVPALAAGVSSLVVPLLACRAFERAGIFGVLPLGACVLGGLGSGAMMTFYASRERQVRLTFLLAGGVVAALVGSLGCLGAGLGGVAAMAAGLVVVAPFGLRTVVRPPT